MVLIGCIQKGKPCKQVQNQSSERSHWGVFIICIHEAVKPGREASILLSIFFFQCQLAEVLTIQPSSQLNGSTNPFESCQLPWRLSLQGLLNSKCPLHVLNQRVPSKRISLSPTVRPRCLHSVARPHMLDGNSPPRRRIPWSR